MKIIRKMRNETVEKKEEICMRAHKNEEYSFMGHMEGKRPIPPHDRRNMLHIEFDEKDWDIFKAVFEDEDTAEAAIDIINGAPPEIQILALQILKMTEEV